MRRILSQGLPKTARKSNQERGAGGGAPKGNRHAFKHGLYAAAAISERKAVTELIRRCRQLVEII
jgi:uncharacterized protein YjcR